MSGRLTGVYQLPDGGFPPRDSKLWIRVPVDRNNAGVTVYSAPTVIPINPPTHPSAPGFYDSGLLPEGPYQVQKAIFGAKDYRSKWYSVVLTEGSHTLQELIEDYDPDAYTPAVVNAVATLRDETRTARDEAAQILEDVTAGAVPDSAVASKITAEGSASRAAVDARVAAGTTGFLTQEVAEETYAPRVGGVFFVGEHGLVGDWAGGDANSGSGTNDTAALTDLIAAVPDGSTIVFDATKTYRLDPLSITGKSLTLDFNGARVVTKTMDSGDLSVASPFISWSSTVGPEVDLSSSGFARGATEVITNPFSGSNGFSTDDLVIVRDRYPVARWDTGANASWVGRGEVNIVQSITPSTGTVRLRIPLSHQYQANFSVVPTLQRISTPVRPVVKNIGLIIDTNPDGMYTGDIETSGGHLFYFYACVDPRVENVRAEGWENHIVNFNKCLRPRTIDIEGRNPFQTGSGHGYIGRMTHCVDGEFTRSVAYGTRHVANYVASARCGSRSCRSYRPAGVSYQTHGLRSRDIYSVDDTVVGGDSSGWSHGNTTYAGDYGYRILRPRYYGTNNGVLARCGSTGTRIIDPEIHTTAKGVEVSSLASDVIVDLTQGTIEIFGEAGTSYAVHAADVNGSGEYKPGSVTVHGPGDLVGTRALVSLDVTGAARIGGVEYDQGDDQLQRWDGTDWAEVESGGAAGVTLDTDQTITGAKSMAEVGFFGTSALGTKPSATDDLGTVLSSLGLRTAGGAYPITTSGAVALTGGFRTGLGNRSGTYNITTNTAPFNMCDASGGAFTISLPNTGSAGYRFTIKKIDASANAVTVSAPIGIDGVPTLVLTDQWEWVEVVSTFTTGQYMIVGRG